MPNLGLSDGIDLGTVAGHRNRGVGSRRQPRMEWIEIIANRTERILGRCSVRKDILCEGDIC